MFVFETTNRSVCGGCNQRDMSFGVEDFVESVCFVGAAFEAIFVDGKCISSSPFGCCQCSAFKECVENFLPSNFDCLSTLSIHDQHFNPVK